MPVLSLSRFLKNMQRENEALRLQRAASDARALTSAADERERERGELEARLRNMTEHLIAKQSQVRRDDCASTIWC